MITVLRMSRRLREECERRPFGCSSSIIPAYEPSNSRLGFGRGETPSPRQLFGASNAVRLSSDIDFDGSPARR